LRDLKTGSVVANAVDCQLVRINDGSSISLCSFYVAETAQVALDSRYCLEFEGGEALIVPIERRVTRGRTLVLALVVDRQEKTQAA